MLTLAPESAGDVSGRQTASICTRCDAAKSQIHALVRGPLSQHPTTRRPAEFQDGGVGGLARPWQGLASRLRCNPLRRAGLKPTVEGGTGFASIGSAWLPQTRSTCRGFTCGAQPCPCACAYLVPASVVTCPAPGDMYVYISWASLPAEKVKMLVFFSSSVCDWVVLISGLWHPPSDHLFSPSLLYRSRFPSAGPRCSFGFPFFRVLPR